jgi:hypothetical protein
MGANAIALVALLLQYSDKVTQMAGLLNTAAKENRDITAAELDQLFVDDNAARDRLQAAIDAASVKPAG